MTFTDTEVEGLAALGITILYAELADDGSVEREIGVDATGAMVHRHPGNPTVARHGLFDLQIIEAPTRSDAVSPADFARLWNI